MQARNAFACFCSGAVRTSCCRSPHDRLNWVGEAASDHWEGRPPYAECNALPGPPTPRLGCSIFSEMIRDPAIVQLCQYGRSVRGSMR